VSDIDINLVKTNNDDYAKMDFEIDMWKVAVVMVEEVLWEVPGSISKIGKQRVCNTC